MFNLDPSLYIGAEVAIFSIIQGDFIRFAKIESFSTEKITIKPTFFEKIFLRKKNRQSDLVYFLVSTGEYPDGIRNWFDKDSLLLITPEDKNHKKIPFGTHVKIKDAGEGIIISDLILHKDAFLSYKIAQAGKMNILIANYKNIEIKENNNPNINIHELLNPINANLDINIIKEGDRLRIYGFVRKRIELGSHEPNKFQDASGRIGIVKIIFIVEKELIFNFEETGDEIDDMNSKGRWSCHINQCRLTK